LSLLVLIFCCSFGFREICKASSYSWKIIGTSKGGSNGSVIYLKYFGSEKKDIQTTLHNEKFIFRGTSSEQEFCTLIYQYNIVALALEPGKIEVKGDAATFSASIVTGIGTLNAEMKDFTKEGASTLNKQQEYFEQMEVLANSTDTALISRIDFLQNQLNQFEDTFIQICKARITKQPGNIAFAGLLLLEFKHYSSFRKEVFKTIYPLFDSTVKASIYGKWMKHLVDLCDIENGKLPFFEVTAYDNNDKVFHLSDYKGNYVLLSVWTSFCMPCRKKHKQIAKLFERYQSSGLTVVTLSLDTDKEQWLKVLKHDSLPFINICNYSGWTEKTRLTYGGYAMGTNFLIAPDGKLVGRDLYDVELITKLDEIFGK